MAANQLKLLDDGHPDIENSRLIRLIGGQVLGALGTPNNCRGTKVQRLWEHHYRANVVVGLDNVSATIAHSYFVVADSLGKILTSNPTIRRQY